MAINAYAPSAIHKRFMRTHSIEIWCTGEDSNLRSSKERQVYSLLPLTARPPVHFHNIAWPTMADPASLRSASQSCIQISAAALGGVRAIRANKVPHAIHR